MKLLISYKSVTISIVTMDLLVFFDNSLCLRFALLLYAAPPWIKLPHLTLNMQISSISLFKHYFHFELSQYCRSEALTDRIIVCVTSHGMSEATRFANLCTDNTPSYSSHYPLWLTNFLQGNLYEHSHAQAIQSMLFLPNTKNDISSLFKQAYGQSHPYVP